LRGGNYGTLREGSSASYTSILLVSDGSIF
jgi:hypothetical protein